MIYEADPLPKGRTTGRLSFGGSPKPDPAPVPGAAGGAGGEEERPATRVGGSKGLPSGGPQYEAPPAADAGQKRPGSSHVPTNIRKKPKA